MMLTMKWERRTRISNMEKIAFLSTPVVITDTCELR